MFFIFYYEPTPLTFNLNFITTIKVDQQEPPEKI